MQRALVVFAILGGACNLDSNLQPPADGPDPDAEPPACPTCQLLVLRPAIAEAGDTLTFDGTFVEPTTVTFPGGDVASATLLGDHRATIVVPNAATAGDLVVTSGGTALPPATFRRASYTLSLQTFARYDNADAPRQNPSLSTARQLAASATIGKFVYVFGGFSASPIATIERAAINADGSLGRFVNANVMLTLPRASATATVIGNHVYIVGGFTTGTAFQSSVERAPIASDGSIGAFEVVSSTLTRVRGQHVAGLIGNFLYVFGGNDSASNTAMSSIERAPIAADGSLGAFSEVGQLVQKRQEAALEISGNSVYVCNGLDSPNGLKTIERATINPDGTLGAFTTVGTTNDGHIGPEAIIANDKLFVIGGQTDRIESADIAGNGSLSAFTTTTSKLTPSRFSSTSVIVEGNFYALGGATSGSSPIVDRASLNASAAFGAPATGNSLVVARRKQASIVSGDFVYVVGGADNGGVPLASVERAPIAPDGTLGTFSVLSSQLGVGRMAASLAVVGDKLFVIGGDAIGVTQSTIEKATINPDGSLGSFTTHGTSLLTPRSFHASVVIGNFVYVIGGVGQSTSGFTLERASIATGDLGSFAAVTNQMQTFRSAPLAMVSQNTLYVIGGFDIVGGAGILKTIEQATIASDGSIGAFSPAPAMLQEGRTNSAAAVIGRFLYVVGGHPTGNATASIERASIAVDGTLGNFSTFSRALTDVRAQHSVVVLRNQLQIIGGGVGSINADGFNTAATGAATLE